MSQPFTLASWNVFQGLHHSMTSTRWVHNDAIERHLRALDADVLVLPEAWQFRRPNARWAEQLADRLGYELHQWVADGPTITHDLVPWRIVLMTRIPARPLPAQVMPKFGKLGQRALVRVELSDSLLRIAAAHMYGIQLLLRRSPRSWMHERRQLQQAAATNDIVVGDLNMWGPVVRRDAPGLRSAVRGRTWPAPRPHSQIDHMLVSDRVDVLSSDVLPDQGSDHLAIRATLQRR